MELAGMVLKADDVDEKTAREVVGLNLSDKGILRDPANIEIGVSAKSEIRKSGPHVTKYKMDTTPHILKIFASVSGKICKISSVMILCGLCTSCPDFFSTGVGNHTWA